MPTILLENPIVYNDENYALGAEFRAVLAEAQPYAGKLVLAQRVDPETDNPVELVQLNSLKSDKIDFSDPASAELFWQQQREHRANTGINNRFVPPTIGILGVERTRSYLAIITGHTTTRITLEKARVAGSQVVHRLFELVPAPEHVPE